ncbi:hypothetical protein OSB04_010193 [Centaurea solstitialis]|uniref:Tf2-1-like SH3-like domain-containing protein n=1 Tax=Centaurea solstitialis TaxID=347529 RepID=A0AA38T8S0_9ASTR|nr:hypothetical protein OSB04_010193 [Centaurea solstitialis]
MVQTRNNPSGSDAEQADQLAAQITAILQQTLPGLFDQMRDKLVQTLDQRIDAALTARSSGSGSTAQSQSRGVTYKDFMTCKPPFFEGQKDPVACYRWYSAVEGAFRTSGCPAGSKVLFAVNLLRNAAKDWWDLVLKRLSEAQITALTWEEVSDPNLLGRVLGSTEVVQRTTEDIQRIRERLRTAQSRQKSYADKRRSDLEFQVGDRVLLTVSPWKGVIRFRKRGKLGPRYIGPFTILARVGKVAYRLELPAVLGQIHNTFHVSQLRKCLADEATHIPLDDIQVDENLNYVERPVAVLDRKVRRLRNKEIEIVKVQWQHRKGSEWTWEPEAEMREHYPELFSD